MLWPQQSWTQTGNQVRAAELNAVWDLRMQRLGKGKETKQAGEEKGQAYNAPLPETAHTQAPLLLQ